MKEKIILLLENSIKELGIIDDNIVLEIPKNKDNGDYSTNIALKNCKKINLNPMDLAQKIIDNINDEDIQVIKIAPPGFINFFLKKDYLIKNINNIINLDVNYGRNNIGNNEKVNIEFVSANPTGILHMGNARGGAYGDSLARIMSFCGYDVTKEYYMNDAGSQITKLASSVYSRYLSLCGIDNEFPENGYPGKEIYDIAEKLYNEYGKKYIDNDFEFVKEFSTKYLTDKIFEHLKEYRIDYDVITSEKDILNKYSFNDAINEMKKNGYIYEKDDAIWFKSSELYDDKDHVLIKNDGSNTYLLPDILYHKDKILRGFTQIIDVLGTDHHGYVARLKSAIKALGLNDEYIDVKLLQLVRIIQNKEVVTMHKRTGKIITLKDLMDDTSVNAVRYYFSKYSLDTQMDFDIDLARSNSNDNQVYYICYAYARICSILNKYNKPIENINNYKIGWEISFDTYDKKIYKKISFPNDTSDFYDYLEVYLYDSLNQEIGAWYSHLLDEQIKDNTLLTTIKLTCGNKCNEITSNIHVKVFSYNGNDDFDDLGFYRGSSYSNLIIKKSNQ